MSAMIFYKYLENYIEDLQIIYKHNICMNIFSVIYEDMTENHDNKLINFHQDSV